MEEEENFKVEMNEIIHEAGISSVSAETEEVLENLPNQTRYLEHHLYYLEDPSKENNWIFLTFPISLKEGEKAILTYFNNRTQTKWTRERTAFNSLEFFTIDGCIPKIANRRYLMEIFWKLLLHFPLSMQVTTRDISMDHGNLVLQDRMELSFSKMLSLT